MLTSDLTGRALDWAVAVVTGNKSRLVHTMVMDGRWSPSTDGRLGAAIIERYLITVRAPHCVGEDWVAFRDLGPSAPYPIFACMRGPTMLKAAMRTLVASHLGPEFDFNREMYQP